MKQFLREVWSDGKKRNLIIFISFIGLAYLLVPLFFSSDNGQPTSFAFNNNSQMFNLDEVGNVDEQNKKKAYESIANDTAKKEQAIKQRENELLETEKKIQSELAKLRLEQAEQKNRLNQMFNEFSKNQQLTLNNSNTDSKSSSYGDNNIITNSANPVKKPSSNYVEHNVVNNYATPSFNPSTLRTITQNQVAHVKKTGVIEVQDVKITAISNNSQEIKTDKPQTNKKKESKPVVEDSFWLSAGSILTGTLLNGVDAPTAGSTQSKMPMPILVRVKHEALMPNNFTLDVRECFIIGSAVGDLATERAYIRSETLSCITENEKAIEIPLTAYVVGSDGKNGMNGRLVTKSGQMMGNAMAAGFLSGLSEAATPQSINVLSTSPSNETQFQSQNFKKMGEAAAFQGAATSFEMIAKYYLELVDASWPVVEILAGREVDFIVQKGTALKIQG